MSANASPLPDPATTEEVAPQDVAAWLAGDGGDGPVLIDCREPEELGICRIEGARHIPLGQFPASITSLRDLAERGIIVTCHHGVRSLRAVRFLRQQGVNRAFSMSGGIDAWSQVIDPSVPRY